MIRPDGCISNRCLLVVVAVLVVSICVVVFGQSQAATGVLEVSVVNAEGEAMPGAMVASVQTDTRSGLFS